jgi:thiol-disulfide isomerase/thioredoxin
MRCLLALALLAVACGPKSSAATATPGGDAAATATAEAASATTIRGTVVGVDGHPPAVAHVRILRPGDGDAEETEIDVDGKFELVTHRRGLALLELTAVDHAQVRLPIVVGPTPIDLQATLGTYARPQPDEGVQVLYWEGDPNTTRPKFAALTRDAKGHWSATIATDAPEIRYQLSGLWGAGRSANGPVSARFEYDGGGDYRSVLIAKQGKVEIAFDESSLLPADRPAKLTFGDTTPGLQRIAAYQLDFDAAVRTYQTAIEAEFARDPAAAQALTASYDWSAARAAARATLDAETDPQVKRVMAIGYFELGNFDPAAASPAERDLAAEVLGEMPAGDPAWLLWPQPLARAVALSSDPAHAARFEQMLGEEMPPGAAADFVFERLVAATIEGNESEARRYYALMMSERLRATPMARIAKQLDPDRAIQTGKPVPAFEFGALPNAKGKVARRFSDEDLHGTVYLLDFWATWCGPCVADMPNLHAAYDKYGVRGKQGRRRKGRKFEILSISVDATADVVHDFRDHRFPMPWQHAQVATPEAAKLFGFTGIPFAVLVDEEGKILASTPQLSGQSLDGILTELLEPPKPGA